MKCPLLTPWSWASLPGYRRAPPVPAGEVHEARQNLFTCFGIIAAVRVALVRNGYGRWDATVARRTLARYQP